MRAFLRRNVYWLLIIGFLGGAVIFEYPGRRPGRAATDLLAQEGSLLKRPVTVNFAGVPLAEALATLGKEANCVVALDASLSTGEIIKVTAHTPGVVPLEQAITLVMRTSDPSIGVMAAWEENGYVRVGPMRLMWQGLQVTAVYNMGNVVFNLEGQARDAKMASLVKLVHESFLLAYSSGPGDTGSVASFDDKLIVRTTPFTQREIANFLGNFQSW